MNIRFKIVEDTDFDPATSVDWSDEETVAYVEQFNSGELAAFGVIVEVEKLVYEWCGRSSRWEHGASLWGVDVFTYGSGRDAMLDLGEGWHTVGEVDLPAAVSKENPGGSYLADVLADLIAEAQSD